MLSWNCVVASVVLCCVIGDVELHSESFESSFRAGLFSSSSQDEDDLLEEERDMEGENRIIAMLAQIIRDMRMKYAPETSYYAPEPQYHAPEPQYYAPEPQYHAPEPHYYAPEPKTPPPPAPPAAHVPDFTYHFSQIDHSPSDVSSIPFAVRPNDSRFYQTNVSSNSKKQIIGAANKDPSHDESRASNSRTPKPKFSVPLMILVKNPDGEDEKQDGTQKHPQHLQTHPAKPLKGRPQWWTDKEGEGVDGQQDSNVFVTKEDGFDDDNMYFIALVAGCSAALLLVIVVGVYSWYKLQRNSKLGADVKYPAYSVGGVTKNGTPPNSGDRRLAHSAQMYHYQHQKQQILALEHNSRDQRRGSVSDADSDDEHDADHTVYECPTLPLTNKKTPDIEVKKPTVETKPTPSLPSSNTSEDNSQDSQTK